MENSDEKFSFLKRGFHLALTRSNLFLANAYRIWKTFIFSASYIKRIPPSLRLVETVLNYIYLNRLKGIFWEIYGDIILKFGST